LKGFQRSRWPLIPNSHTRMKNEKFEFHKIILAIIYLLHVLIVFYLPLNIIDADQDWIDGIGFIIVWSVIYIKRLKEDQYYEEAIENKSIYKDWVIVLVAFSFPIIVLLSSGFGKIWHGIAWGLISALGIVLQNWIVRTYIGRYIKTN